MFVLGYCLFNMFQTEVCRFSLKILKRQIEEIERNPPKTSCFGNIPEYGKHPVIIKGQLLESYLRNCHKRKEI